MPELGTLAVFVAAAFVLLVVPGPSVLYIVARGIDQGRAAALVSAAGVTCGSAVHLAAAVLGLSVLVASTATAFAAVKYLGAAYLIVLGIRTLLTKSPVGLMESNRRQPVGRLFAQGMVVQVFNPKVALFFLAFLPQFVDPARGSVALQTAFLGAILIGMGWGTDSLYGLLAGSLGGVLRTNRAFASAQRWVSGTVLIGLGLSAAISGSGNR